MKLSFGTNMAHGFRYFTMLTQELPELLNKYFPVDLSKQVIAGAEEGAYAALRAALKYPNNYKIAIGLSCGSLTDETLTGTKKELAVNAFGTGEMELLNETDYSLRLLMKKQGRVIPDIYLAYGNDDIYAESCRILANALESTRRNKIEQLEGELTWQTWFRLLQRELKRIDAQQTGADEASALED